MLIVRFVRFIDLIFTSQPNLVVESGIHPSLHPHCHRQINFPKTDLKILLPTTLLSPSLALPGSRY